MHTFAPMCMCQWMECCQGRFNVKCLRQIFGQSVFHLCPSCCPSCCRRDRVVRVLKLPTAPDDYAFMLSEDYAAAVQQQQQLMQVWNVFMQLFSLPLLPARSTCCMRRCQELEALVSSLDTASILMHRLYGNAERCMCSFSIVTQSLVLVALILGPQAQKSVQQC